MGHRRYTFSPSHSVGILAAVLVAFGGCSAQQEGEQLGFALQSLTSYAVSFQNGTNGYAGAIDSQLSENAPTSNYGTTNILLSDGDDPYNSGKDSSAVLRWDVSSIPSDATVTSVSLRVYVTDGSASAYSIYLLNRSWSGSSTTWNLASTGASWQTAGAKGAADRGTTAIGSLSKSSAGALTVTLNSAGIAAVQGWVANSSQNYGIIVANSSNTDGLRIASSEDTTVGNRPQLTINYTRNMPGTGGGTSTGGTQGTGGAATGGVSTGGNTATGGSTQVIAVGDIADCTGEPTGTGRNGTATLLDGLAGPVVTMGDDNNMTGSLATYLSCFDPAWGRHKSRIRPAPGNHDYMTSGAQGYIDYFTPAVAKPAGSTYYSYDVGSWHFIALDGNITASTGSAQETWLRQDLAAHTGNHCTVAYFHQPRFSSGAHGANTNMQAVWQALNDYGVELAISGHDHGYERFYPMSASGARLTNGKGVEQFIVGTGGAPLRAFSTVATNSAARIAQTYGVLKLTLRGTGYDWAFVPIAGQSGSDSGSRECYDP
jgi:hypothetical protein